MRLTPAQTEYAEQVAGICRAVWNTGLDQRRQYRQRDAWVHYHQQAKELAQAKTEPGLEWLADAPAHCLQQDLMDLEKACRAHGTWAVKFRPKNRWAPSFRFPEGKHMRVQRLAKRWGQINLPKFGQVRLRLTRDVGGTIRSATLNRDGVNGDWYVSVLVEDNIIEVTPPVEDLRPAVGVDRGVKVALALSDGRMLDQPFTFDAETARVKTLQRRAARQHGPRTPGSTGRKGRRQPSKRWQRTQKQIGKIAARQRRRRDDFTARTAHALAAGHSLVAVEDLKVKAMTGRAKPVPDPDHAGVFLPNRAAQKSGLNRAILGCSGNSLIRAPAGRGSRSSQAKGCVRHTPRSGRVAARCNVSRAAPGLGPVACRVEGRAGCGASTSRPAPRCLCPV